MENITFDFNYYRFNGKGNRPMTVPSVEQANFMRSRYSVEEGLVNLATQRVKQWAEEHDIRLYPRNPYPSKQQGRYWLEFHFGGLTL